MAKESGLGQRFFVGGYDISGDVQSVDGGMPRNLLDATAIDKSAHERLLGLADGRLAWNAFFNDAAGQAHAALSTLPTSDVDVMWATGIVAGDPAAMLRAKQVGYDPSRTADGGLIFGVEAQAAAGKSLEWGNMVTAGKITHASASSSATYDAGAASATGCMAQIQVFDIDSGTPTFILQDNTVDNGAWATYISFGAVADGSEPTTVRAEESDVCNRYRRVTTTGTFTNADFAVAMREGEATDEEAYSG